MEMLKKGIDWYAKKRKEYHLKLHDRAAEKQAKVLINNILDAEFTRFGHDHQFSRVKSPTDFIQQVPVRTYESLESYIEEARTSYNVLWPGKAKYMAMTSGTTAGSKYIPISRDSIGHHIRAARDTLLFYLAESGNASLIEQKMMFLQGSPTLTKKHGILEGRLSGIVYHHVPFYLMRNRLPSFETNSIGDWNQKLKAIIEEIKDQRLSVLGGIPPWVIMLAEMMNEKTGKSNLQEHFTDLKLFIHGGLNVKPYLSRIRSLIGPTVDLRETYPASEGFLAFQDEEHEEGLLLNLDAGIFYEFISMDDLEKENPRRKTINEVELNVPYAIVLTTNAGLWAYQLGDLIKFTHLNPYRIRVCGRTSQYINAFGEHVIREEVDSAFTKAVDEHKADIEDFFVAPHFGDGEDAYELILVTAENRDWTAFAGSFDRTLADRNAYYKHLRDGDMLKLPKVSTIVPGALKAFLAAQGKLGGQNKVRRLHNSRELIDELLS